MADIAFVKDPITGVYDIANRKVTDLDVVIQKIYIRLSIIKGEWAANPNIGISLEQLAQFSVEAGAIAQVYADEILQVPNVTSAEISDIQTDQTNRVTSITFVVNTAFGQTTITV